MQHIYSDPDHWAHVQLIDLTFVMPKTWIIGGFQVHRKYQRKGHGTRLFQQVLDDADREGVTLLLTAYGSDDERLGLTHEQLIDFYKRRGFVLYEEDDNPRNLIRHPRSRAMSDTHDHPTKVVPATDLNNTHVLVGESGGLSAVYEPPRPLMGGLSVITEHGTLYLNNEDEITVYDDGTTDA